MNSVSSAKLILRVKLGHFSELLSVMAPKLRPWAVCLSVCLAACLGVSLLLSVGVWREMTPLDITLVRSGRSPFEDGKQNEADIPSVYLPKCSHPVAKINSTSFKYMRKFTGRKIVRYTSVYPRDGTTLPGKRRDTGGNEVIPWKAVSRLKLVYHSAVNNRGTIAELTKIEQTALLSGDVIYFIETNTTNPVSNIQYFVTVQRGALCCLPDFRVDLRRRVVVVATSKNLGDGWMRRFVDEFSEIVELTDERNFQIIVTDFMSENVDVQKLFDESILRDRSKVITMDMAYNKPIGVEKAVTLIQNPDDVIFLCDFHLEIPLDFFSRIRKHVIPGHMVFAPVVAKLNEGSTPAHPEGAWDYNGFGMLGIARSDWDAIGGINSRDFSDQWGGEDWDMIDRVIQHGLHVSRMRVPGLFHHYHTKTGMWPGGRLKLGDI